MPAVLPTARLACAVAIAVLACAPEARQRPRLTIFAAASVGAVVDELAIGFERREGVEVTVNVAGSNVLARQLLAAPVADLFLSADERWARAVADAGHAAQAPRALWSNELVVIAHRDAPWPAVEPAELAELPIDAVAVADPDAVPAGRYARVALGALDRAGADLWSRLADRLVPTADVRAALALVEADPRIIGVVYRTDAERSERVRTLCRLPLPDGEPPIAVHAVVLAGGGVARAQSFLAYVEGDGAAVVRRHGFGARG